MTIVVYVFVYTKATENMEKQRSTPPSPTSEPRVNVNPTPPPPMSEPRVNANPTSPSPTSEPRVNVNPTPPPPMSEPRVNVNPTPPPPMSEPRVNVNPFRSNKIEDTTALNSSQGTVKGSTSESANMSKDSLLAVSQHSVGKSLEFVAAKSMEVLKLPSIGNLEKTDIEQLSLPRKRQFIVNLGSRKKPPEILEDEITVEAPVRNVHAGSEAQRRRRSAWGAQSIAATATIMTRRDKWVRSRSKKILTISSVLERYQQRIEDMFGSCNACFFEFVRNLLAMNVCLMIIWTLFVVLPQAIYFDYSTIKGTFYFEDILKFRGVVGETWLFFGNYEAEVSGYHMWFAYFVCFLCTFYFSLFWLITGIVMTLLDEGGHVVLENYNFSYLTFTAWDYSLRNVEATDILCLGIANSFKDLIIDVEVNRRVQAMRAIDKTKLYMRRALAWLITVFLISVGCGIIFSVVTADTVELFESWGFKDVSRDQLTVSYFPTAVFTIVNLVVPAAIYELPRFESYIKPQLEVYITICRVFLLHVADIVSLFLSLKLKIYWERYTGCGGTLIGQEIFKLIVIDTVVMFGTALVAYLGHFLVFKFKKREFFMPAIVLKVIQEQTLIWIGTLACPLMPALGCLFLILTFFTYYNMICRFCSPTSKRWLQPHRNIFFLAMTVIALMVLTITFVVMNLTDGGFLLSKLVPLTGVNQTWVQYANRTWCGPLNIDGAFSPIWNFIKQVKSDDAMAGRILDIVCSPLMIITVLFVLVSVIYLLVCRVKWEVEKRLVLLAEVQMERLQVKKYHPVVGDKSRHIEK